MVSGVTLQSKSVWVDIVYKCIPPYLHRRLSVSVLRFHLIKLWYEKIALDKKLKFYSGFIASHEFRSIGYEVLFKVACNNGNCVLSK